MIHADPILAAAQTVAAAALAPVPVAIEDAPNAAEFVTLEAAGSQRPGMMCATATDLALRIRIRGVARGPGARRRSRRLAEEAAATLLTAPVTGTGWTISGRTHIADNGTDDAGDLANTTIEVELHAIQA